MALTREEHERWMTVARERMIDFVSPLITPITLSRTEGRGEALGTGNYIWINGAAYLLTNEHVITDGVGGHLGHLPGPTDDYVAMAHHIVTAERPIDMALMRLGDEWNEATKGVATISMFDRCYDPVESEFLFFIGYPGTRATRLQTPIRELHARHTAFGGPIENLAVPIITQAFRDDPGPLLSFEPAYHSAIHLPARAPRVDGGPAEDLPNAGGMSGSLLWDTKFVACANRGISWGPHLAKVCGLIRTAHPRPEVAGFTRVEHLLPVLLDWIRHERAFIHWLDRGEPLWQEGVDWEWAEREFPELRD